ncbi:hypothetical protein SEA_VIACONLECTUS_70 [Gordonia phage ViaConlectus]|uniref:Uncharacterized protein n=1 Tax=Gordonia phage ViaConlectus TaxID=2972515 RepID=A0A976YGX4_9CAUD|nr:hypothetical protein SEA_VIACONLECTUS_70 [Gordonia phage ViaConlectus]
MIDGLPMVIVYLTMLVVAGRMVWAMVQR